MTDYTLSQDGSGADYSVVTHNEALFSAGDQITILGIITAAIIPPSSGSLGNHIVYVGGLDASIEDLTLEAFTIDGVEWITIRNLAFDGKKTCNKGIAGRTECSSIWIYQCMFIDYQQQAIQLSASTGGGAYGEDILIEECGFLDIGVWGDSSAVDINITGYHRRATCLNNTHATVTANRGVDGVTFSQNTADGTGHLVKGCTFTGDYEENFIDFKGVAPGSSGEIESIVEGCVITGGGTKDTQAFHVQLNSRNIIIRKNTVSDCDVFLLFVAQGAGNDAVGYVDIEGNLVHDIKRLGISEGLDAAQALGHNTIRNNTFVDIGTTSDGQYSLSLRAENYSIENNIFDKVSLGLAGGQAIRMVDETPDPWDTMTLNGNCYINYTGSAGTEDLVYKHSATTSYTLSELQGLGFEADGIQTADAQLDANYKPASTSPCIGAGIKWWEANGRPVGWDGEPYPDWDIDMGGVQATFSLHHPSNS